jgi:hypothetical protein
MLKTLVTLSKKTIVASVTSLAMVGTAGAALGTTLTVQEDSSVESTVVDSTTPDTSAPDTTVVDTTIVDTTLVDTTLVETTLTPVAFAGQNGLCEAWLRSIENGRPKKASNPAWSRLAEAATAAATTAEAACAGVIEAKRAADDSIPDDSVSDDTLVESPEMDDEPGTNKGKGKGRND